MIDIPMDRLVHARPMLAVFPPPRFQKGFDRIW